FYSRSQDSIHLPPRTALKEPPVITAPLFMSSRTGRDNYSGSRFAPVMAHVNASVDHIERPLMTPDEVLRLKPPRKTGAGSRKLSKFAGFLSDDGRSKMNSHRLRAIGLPVRFPVDLFRCGASREQFPSMHFDSARASRLNHLRSGYGHAQLIRRQPA